ncbi:MAG: tRNA-splicing endonuclease subunit alpha [Candidatus Aramenus sulfurataquae]|jgi:tRNA-intron endonuclease|uniref:tRNA-splicing endonuclease n=2 Tax=Candidatus Aramenus sulfurataquae TaxID=1326980 RepID=W7L910_9CREN|nr:MAG: tRNA-splicing endonuclease subunit alpha [Candidatus Aramenus sulfurataquae]MCL7343440.1 tRNA-intron lyase [Candidatus Aramenus sulfurataquae]
MPAKGYLLYDRIVVPDPQEAKGIYNGGFYGKPIGVSKPKKEEELERPLELSLIEGVYLAKKSLLEVYSDGKSLSDKELYEYAKNIINKFEILYAVYEDLRKRGFVVRSGIKFGADFAVYNLGPGIEHAPYVVIALDENAKLFAHELMSFGRVSHSTRKKLVLAIVNLNTKNIRYIIFKWVKM